MTLKYTQICAIHCDDKESVEQDFDCGLVSQCYFYCEDDDCLRQRSLSGSDTDNLMVISSKPDCKAVGTMNVPNNGNASFTALSSSESNKALAKIFQLV